MASPEVVLQQLMEVVAAQGPRWFYGILASIETAHVMTPPPARVMMTPPPLVKPPPPARVMTPPPSHVTATPSGGRDIPAPRSAPVSPSSAAWHRHRRRSPEAHCSRRSRHYKRRRRRSTRDSSSGSSVSSSSSRGGTRRSSAGGSSTRARRPRRHRSPARGHRSRVAAPPRADVRRPPSAVAVEVAGISQPTAPDRPGGCSMSPLPVDSHGQHLPLVDSLVAQSIWTARGVRPSVWLVGDSSLLGAERRAAVSPIGTSLGLYQADVFWKGFRGLRWLQILPEVVAISGLVAWPTVLVVHAGGNDLCHTRLDQLLALIKSDTERFALFFHNVILVWSEIFPRVIWRGARNAAAVERSRRLLNIRVSRLVRSRGGVVVRHRRLEGDNQSLLSDGVHLNDSGLDIFLAGLQEGVQRALFLLGGGKSSLLVVEGTPCWSESAAALQSHLSLV
ncbi:uncharacterized protein LOC142710253 isoform X1 [Rhinoderma darwinii]|uniref:uncharacterized protein LOC142710253 isoform X1 n=1 Tax=Rhinoderma darwinii TaxID=43563 RepID=UPI003F66A644